MCGNEAGFISKLGMDKFLHLPMNSFEVEIAR